MWSSKFCNRSTLLFLWRSSGNKGFLTYRKLSNLLPSFLPSPSFHHHVYLTPYFWWFWIYLCHFLCCLAIVQPHAFFPGYSWRGSQAAQPHPSIHGEFFLSQFVLLKFLTFRWPICTCLRLVVGKGIVTIKSARPSTIFTWTCWQHLWIPAGISGRLMRECPFTLCCLLAN